MIMDGFIESDGCHCPQCSPEANDIKKCWVCGHYHNEEICPLVGSIEYFKDGSIKKMTFRYPSFPWTQFLVK